MLLLSPHIHIVTLSVVTISVDQSGLIAFAIGLRTELLDFLPEVTSVVQKRTRTRMRYARAQNDETNQNHTL